MSIFGLQKALNILIPNLIDWEIDELYFSVNYDICGSSIWKVMSGFLLVDGYSLSILMHNLIY